MQIHYAFAPFSQQRLSLADATPIGMGNRRRDFVHPSHPDLCIKIARNQHIRRGLDRRGGLYRLMPTRWRDDNWLEARAYQQTALREDASPNWQYVPHLHGWQPTDMGDGLVFDYYRTPQGEPAPSLEALLQNGMCGADLERALTDLAVFFGQNGFVDAPPRSGQYCLGQ